MTRVTEMIMITWHKTGATLRDRIKHLSDKSFVGHMYNQRSVAAQGDD